MAKKIHFTLSFFVIMLLLFNGCTRKTSEIEEALASISAEDLKKDVKILSSDEFEGRSPASKGEELTIEFLKNEFQALGLKPGNKDSFFQEVPLIKINSEPSRTLEILGSNASNKFQYGDEFVSTTKQIVEKVSLRDSEMIYVGYGIVAPEYGWNDYEGIDVKGKTVVIQVNDPGFATQDPDLFNGRAMTYYGRWTYKYEEAAHQGAAGALIIHETEPAYGWDVVHNGWTGPQFLMESPDNNMSRCAVEGWITLHTTQAIFKQAGLDFNVLKTDAAQKGFSAINMGLKANLTLSNTIEYSRSHNVIALLPGSERPEELIFYTAHWDHFAPDPSLEGDQIFNGALDNATGTAALIELAEAFLKLKTPPPRSIAFLAVTAEEQGLLGSKYYAANPIFPLTNTVASINMDSLNIYGRMKDITIVGFWQSELGSQWCHRRFAAAF